MNEQDYQFLLNLYETKNITKMAQQQFLTQPAMTRRIQRIEEELGCQLVLRTKKGVIFTPAGEEAVKYCRDTLMRKEQLTNTINRHLGIVGGSLSIGCSLNYCRYRLPNILYHFKKLYPFVDISIIPARSKDIYRMLLKNEISIAIIRGNYSWNEDSFLLSSEPLCLVRSKKNANRPLQEYSYIGRHTDMEEEKKILLWGEEQGLSLQNASLWIDDITSCREMALAELGWTILPNICLDKFEGAATPLFLKDGTPLLRNTSVFYRTAQYELQQVKCFLDLLSQHTAHPDSV